MVDLPAESELLSDIRFYSVHELEVGFDLFPLKVASADEAEAVG